MNGYVFQFGAVWANLPLLLLGALHTVLFSAGALVAGLAAGVGLALMRGARGAAPRLLSGAYIEFIRNTPLLVQLFIVFFGLPSAGVRLTPDQAAALALVLNFSAYSAEIVRAGIEAVPHGQIEAALSLGMTRWEVLRHAVLLPAIERVYPALASQLTLLMLGSAIISAIGADELTSAANYVQSQTFRSFEVYLVTTGLYIALTVLFRAGLGGVARLAFPRRRALGLAFVTR